MTTLTGHVRHSRSYYHCARCGHGFSPADDDLSPNGRYSKAAENVIALAGIHEAFRPASGLLRRMAGMRVPHATVRRLTEDTGKQLAKEQDKGQAIPQPAQAEPWDFHLLDEDGERLSATVGYVGVDAFSVPTLEADGTVAWRMLYVGILYPPGKEQRRYLADFDLGSLAAQLRPAAVACGFGRAEKVVALTDGGNGLRQALASGFGGNTTFVLDFWHATQHLFTFTKDWCADAGTAQRLGEEGKRVLREQGGSGLLSWLENQAEASASAERAEAYRKLHVFITNQEGRMDYPAYRLAGWDIGSGPVESECKVLGRRLKGTGHRWNEEEVEAVAKLRAVYKSDEDLWDAYFGCPTP